jgi:hypothetical protein
LNIRLILIYLSAICLISNFSFSQSTADSSVVKKHSPKTASILSACVPGLGQAYNKKYWKIPVIYAGIAAFTYFANDNNKEYLKYKQAYKFRTDTSSGTIDQYVNILTTQNLLDEKNRWRKYRDICIIGGFAFYILNIIDANVDANLFNYEINEDLSIKFEPVINCYSNIYKIPCFTFTITFQ